MGWLKKNPEFAEEYARAHEDSADADAELIKDIQERVILGEIDPQAGRVAIDSLKWCAGKRKPKKYGDKLELDANVKSSINVIIGGDV